MISGDVSVTAVTGTKMDRQMDLLKQAKSRFTGFAMDSAAVSMNMATQMLPEDIDSTVAMIEPLLEEMNSEIDDTDDIGDEAKPAVKRLANSLVEVIIDTLKTGKFDSGMSMMFDDAGMNMIAAAHIADGAKLEQNIKEIAAMLEGKPNAPKLRLNADQHAGVRFHVLSVTVPEEEEEARKALGDSLEIAIGIAKESAYVSMGKQGMDLVRKAIDKSGAAREVAIKPMSMRVTLGPIMRFVSSIDDNEVVSAIASALEKTKDDLILARVEAIDHGSDYHFEVREGVLNAIGEGIQAAQADEIE